MKLYCGIDLHSNNHYISIIDQKDKRLKEKRLSNDLSNTLHLLEPYRNDLQGIAIESTFNWYWLVDGLIRITGVSGITGVSVTFISSQVYLSSFLLLWH